MEIVRHVPSCPPPCPKCGKFNCAEMMSFNGVQPCKPNKKAAVKAAKEFKD